MQIEFEKAIHLTEKYGFNKLLYHITDLISLIDKDGNYLYKSPAAEKVLGYPVDYFIGKSCFDLVHPDDKKILQANFQEHVVNGVNFPPSVYRFRHQNGTWKYLEVSSTNQLAEEQLSALVVVSRDVTERIEAESTIKESELRFKKLIEASEDLVWQMNSGMRFTYISPGIYPILGFAEEDSQVLNLQNYASTSFDTFLKNSKIEEAISARKAFSNIEHTFVNQDGQIVYMESTGVPLFATDHTYIGYTGVSRDITNRILQQQLLFRREQQYRCLFDQNVDAVFSIAPDGTFTSVNAVTAELIGYTKEELIASSFVRLLHPSYLTEDLKRFGMALQGYPQQYRTCVVNKEGKTMHVFISKIPVIIDDVVTGVYGIAKDITAQVNAEESLRNSEEFFRAIFQSSMSGVLIVNVDDGFIVEANEAACKLFNKDYRELNFSHLSSLEKPGKENKASILELCRQHEGYRGEHLFVRADGSSIHAEFSLFRFKNSGGQHLYGIAIQDVTEWHRQEQEKKLLAQINKTFTESDLLEDALEKVLEIICEFLKADWGEAWIPGFNNDRIDLKAYWSNPSRDHSSYLKYIKSLDVVKGGTVACKAWETHQIDWVENIDEVPEPVLRDSYRKEGFDSYISMPIVFRNEVVAVLKIFSSKNIIRKDLSDFINQLIHQLGPEIERKKTAEELNRFFELSPDMLCIISTQNGRFLKFNKASQHILGYNAEEFAALSFYQLIHPEDLASFQKEIEKLERGEAVSYTEKRYLCKDGNYKWLAWTGKPFIEEKIVYAVVKDINDVKAANEEIKRSAIRLNTIVESISDGFFTLDKNWMFSYLNREFENATGIRISRLLNRNIWEAFPLLQESDLYHNFQKAVLQQKAQRFEHYCADADAWYAMTADPSEEGLSVFVRNITESKRANSMMLIERKVLEMNASSTEDLPKLLNCFLRSFEAQYKGMLCDVVLYNELEEETQCLSTQHMPAAYWEYVKGLQTDRQEEEDEDFIDERSVARVETDIQALKHWAEHRSILEQLDIHARWSFPIVASNNRVLATLVISHHQNREPSNAELQIITRVRSIIGLLVEKEQAEQALIKSHEALRKLNSYVQNAREKELKHLAREIHDELGQVLTALKIDITLLYRTIANEETVPNLDEVRKNVAEVMEMVNEAIASVRRIVRDLRPVVLDDLGLISEIESRAQEFSRKMNIDVELMMKVDKLHLKQEKATEVYRILQESLTNVARHAQASKVKIIISYVEDNILMFEIEDNGRGFIMAQRNKQSYGLLGMHERALMIGGELTLNSVPGKGTKVTLTVPNND